MSDLPKDRSAEELGTRLSARYLRRRRIRRRIVDLAVTAPAVILTAPIWAAVALSIRLTDPGPVLFVQEREGYGQRPFGMVKFRSMYVDADRRLQEFLTAHPERRVEWERTFKLDPDPRVLPRIGDFLRRSSFDEFPNLLNVLRGEMTLVGPRPFPAYHLHAYPEKLRLMRAQLVPGVTGLWQVVRGDLNTQVDCDIKYIEQTTGWYDTGLVLKTLPLLIRGKKHY